MKADSQVGKQQQVNAEIMVLMPLPGGHMQRR